MKTVYAVINKEGTISYVGCTKNIKNREYQHRAYNSSEVDHLEALEEVEDNVATEREIYWIRKLIDEGHPLKNRENKKKTERWNNKNPEDKKQRHGVVISGNSYNTLTRICQERGMFAIALLDNAIREWCINHGETYESL